MTTLYWDIATMELEQTEVIPIDSVRVQVCMTASTAPEEIQEVIPAIRESLGEITRSDWEILGIKQGEDSVGMIRLRVHATARVTVEDLAGLTAKLKGSSRSGYRAELVGTRFRAPESERHAAVERVRLRLYEQVNMQIRSMNEAFPEPSGHWRLAEISLSTYEGCDLVNDFLDIERSIQAQFKRPKQSKGDGGEDEEPTVVKMTNRITVHAKVTLRRPALHST